MKVHISNIYGFIKDKKLAGLQRYIAEMGRELHFLEMGIYCFDTSSDTYEEMGKRIDGIIASIEASDVVVLQLPTGNGLQFERRLINKIKVYGASVILLMEDFYQEPDITALDGADILFAKNKLVLEDCVTKGFKRDKAEVMQAIEGRSKLEGQCALLNMVKPFYGKNYDEQKVPDEDMLHVCFGLHDAKGTYSIEVGVVMQSIVENTNAKICFHIFIDDTVSKENQRRLRNIADAAGDIVKFHVADVEKVSVENKYIKTFTIGTMFRLLIPDVLQDLKKVIYLDADLLFNKDIQELWDIDIDEYCLAAVNDLGLNAENKLVKWYKHFNAGVLVMNLDNIRKEGNLAQRVIDVLSGPLKDAGYPDQDALNYLFSEKTLYIDDSWNTLVYYAKTMDFKIEDRVFHFAARKYIDYEDQHCWDEKYIQVKNGLNWSNDVLSEYGRVFKCMLGKYKNFQCLAKEIGKGKKKIFYGDCKNTTQDIIEIFGINECDYFVECNNKFGDVPIKDKSQIKEEKKGDFVVLVLPEASDGNAISYLTELGLERNVDYFDLRSVVFASQGGYIL